MLPGPTRSAGVEEFAGQLSGGKPFAEFEKEFFKTFRPSSLLKRFAMTEEVANLVTYVCSPLSAATNGAALRVDGGVVQSGGRSDGLQAEPTLTHGYLGDRANTRHLARKGRGRPREAATCSSPIS